MVANYLVRSSFHLKKKYLFYPPCFTLKSFLVAILMGTFTHSTGDVDIETGGDEDRGGEGEQEEEGEVVHDEAGDDFIS